jgi:two-component system, NarL family, sensor kinase
MKENGIPDTELPRPGLWSSASGSGTYLQALIENSPIAIVILDANHHYRMCNPAFEQLFQYSHSELLSSDLDNLIARPELVQEAAELSRIVLQGSKVHTVTQRRRKDGMTVDVELHGVPLVVDGQLTGVYGLYQDLTERNRAKTELLQMSDKLLTLQLEERRRIARDLHDATSQELAVLNWNLSRLKTLVKEEDQTLRDLVEQTKELAAQCSARIRSASYLLHPPLLEKAGLSSAVARLAEGFEQRSGIRVMVDTPAELGRFSGEAEFAVFRTVQESLANVLRHSGSPVVRISLRKNSQWLKLAVADEGKSNRAGLVLENFEERGLGIRGMRERLEQLGGWLTITRSIGGTTLVAAVPAGVC